MPPPSEAEHGVPWISPAELADATGDYGAIAGPAKPTEAHRNFIYALLFTGSAASSPTSGRVSDFNQEQNNGNCR